MLSIAAAALVVGVVVVAGEEDATLGEATDAVVRSCELALGDGACQPGARAPDAQLQALVVFTEDSLEIDLSDAASRSVHRSLNFSSGDTNEQRWTAAGLLVAALSAAWVPERPQKPAAEAPRTHVLPSPPKAPRRTSTMLAARRTAPWFVDAGGLLAAGLSSEQVHAGGELRGVHALGNDCCAVTLSVRLTRSLAGEPSTWQGQSGVGFEVPWTFSNSLRLSLLGEGLVDYVEPSFVRDGVQESHQALRWGGSVGVRLGWGRPGVGFWVGGAGGLLAPSLVLRVQREVQVETSLLHWNLGLGARFWGPGG